MERPFSSGIRRFWRGETGMRGDSAARLAGSSDVFDRRARRPWASVNYAASHDGYTLTDIVSYAQRHNEANGESNHDGHGENYSANWGVEGRGATIRLSRKRVRAYCAVCWRRCFSRTAHRCYSPETSSSARSAATTTRTARTTRSSWLDWKQASSPEGKACFDCRRRMCRRDSSLIAPRLINPRATLPSSEITVVARSAVLTKSIFRTPSS